MRAGAMGFGTSFARFTVPERINQTMSSPSTKNVDVELRWKTYLKGVVFLLPALILWEAVSLKCVPILVNIWRNSGHHRENAENFWNFSMFFVHYGFQFLQPLSWCSVFSSCSAGHGHRIARGCRRRGLVVEFCRDLRFGFAIHADSHRISESAQVSGSPSKSTIAPIG